MTTYNTKNPVPSADARDRYDNSQVFDELMNGPAPKTPDRMGVLRQSVAGMEQAFQGSEAERAAAFQAFLDASGWSTLGDYAAGISIVSHTQTVDYQGQPYQLKSSVPASIDAPYITTGDWATEGANFKLVGDNVLRQDLLTDGVTIVGGAGLMLDGVVALRTTILDSARTYTVEGFFAGSTIGGGVFKYSAALPKALHDGRNVISPTVPWDGALAGLSDYLDGLGETAPTGTGAFVRLGDAPVRLSEVGGTSAGMNKMLSTGGLKVIPDGVWRLGTSIVRDFSSDDDFPNTSEPSDRFVLRGDSITNSILLFDGPGYAFNLKGANSPPTGQNVLTQTELSQFSLKPSGALASCSGIRMLNQAYVSLKDLNIEYCDYALILDSTITSKLDNVFLRSNEVGLQLAGNGFSMPNALAISRLTAQANRYAAISAPVIGGGVKIDGATIEGNGTMGVGGSGGIIGNIDGINGSATLQLSNVYFEGNKGTADLYLENKSSYTVTVVLIGCNFHRISPTEYVEQNISLSNTGGGKIRCVMIGCAFMTAGTYEPSPSRPFITHDQGTEIVDIGCSYNEEVSLNRSISASVSVVGRVGENGVPLAVPTGITSARIALGIYTVTSAVGWGANANGYVASAVVSSGSARVVQRVVQNSATEFLVVVTDAAGNAADAAFNFACVRVS